MSASKWEFCNNHWKSWQYGYNNPNIGNHQSLSSTVYLLHHNTLTGITHPHSNTHYYAVPRFQQTSHPMFPRQQMKIREPIVNHSQHHIATTTIWGQQLGWHLTMEKATWCNGNNNWDDDVTKWCLLFYLITSQKSYTLWLQKKNNQLWSSLPPTGIVPLSSTYSTYCIVRLLRGNQPCIRSRYGLKFL